MTTAYGNNDGCADRKGVNKYQAKCVDDEAPDPTTGPSDRRVPRDGFSASVACEAANDFAKAHSEAALGAKEVDTFQRDHVERLPAEPVRVGRAASKVNVKRKLGEGITVTVDSIARNIEIPGLGTIGAVRAEATSTATGRDGRAIGTYTRTICDIQLGALVVSGCLGDAKQQASIVKQLNDTFGGRVELRLRSPDRVMIGGTPHGYLAAVQRDRKQVFGDQTISRDKSLAVPGLEVIFFQGEGPNGAGRQIFQLAGVEASTSYGIACALGQAANGQCAAENEILGDDNETVVSSNGETIVVTEVQEVESARSGDESTDRDAKIIRLLKKIPQAIAEAVRLLFNNPRELGLMAAVWGLLYAPCYLGERRRSIRRLSMRRATAGGVG